MQLTGPEILRRMQIKNPRNPDGKPDITITPFDEKCLGSNSYDLHLGSQLKIYKNTLPYYSAYIEYRKYPEKYDPRNPRFLLDPCDAESHKTTELEIPRHGLILSPSIGYLGHTVEYTETYNLFPYIDGKSSVGRNFILNHHTAGRGDDGFCGQWTLEIKTLYPTVVYPDMRIGQIYYEEFTGARKPYNQNMTSHYNGQMGPTPAAIIPIENICDRQR